MNRLHRAMIGAVVALLLALPPAPAARAVVFPILDGDPVDGATGRAYEILPGLPLILPQPDGKFEPPVIDATIFGDVDLVVRAGSPMVGPAVPPPSASPMVGVAGSAQVAWGTEIPFTVIASDGAASPAAGNPLLGVEMDGIPVVVMAYADLDGDGFVGPTNDDPQGSADNVRELQESDFLVGRQVAIFQGGVAQGTIAVWKGAPASAGGLPVALTAVAYVGPFDLGFLAGNVPDGPGVSTLLPYFPRLDPTRVVEGEGRGGPAGPGVRLGFEFEPAFDTLQALALGLPLALPTDGSGVTTDRAVVDAGPYSRPAFVRPSSAVNFPRNVRVPLHPGAAGVIYEPLPSVDVVDDGPGAPTKVRVVPVDVFDNVTDPQGGAMVTVVAGPGVLVSSPDGDADPTRETINLAAAAGMELSLDDDGGVGDSGTASRVWLTRDGFPVASLDVNFTPGGGGGGPQGIEIRDARIDGDPAALVAGCRSPEEMSVDVFDPQQDAASVTGSVLLNGEAIGKVNLKDRFAAPPGQPNVTDIFEGRVQMNPRVTGPLEIVLAARDAMKNVSGPFSLFLPVVPNQPPEISDVSLSTTRVTLGSRDPIQANAGVSDDCGVSRVSVEMDVGRGFRRVGTLRDDGRKGDAKAGDGVFSGPVKVKAREPGTFPLRVVAEDGHRARSTSAPMDVQVVSP